MDERVIVDYLLGDLNDAETERLDELSIRNKEFADELNGVENDLVDAYVGGELSESDRAKFQSHYLASPRRREKVSFAKAFLATIDQPVKKTEGLMAFRREGFFAASRAAFRWGLAFAAIVVFLVSGFLLFQNMQLRSQLADLQNEESTLRQQEKDLQAQLSGERLSATEKDKEINRIRTRLTEVEQQLAVQERRAENMFAFKLAPSARGVRNIPRLILPVSSQTVRFTLLLDPNDFAEYHAVLKEPATGKELWRSNRLNGDGSVQFQIPANLLQSQIYSIELYGISPGGVEELFSSYSFSVLRK